MPLEPIYRVFFGGKSMCIPSFFGTFWGVIPSFSRTLRRPLTCASFVANGIATWISIFQIQAKKNQSRTCTMHQYCNDRICTYVHRHTTNSNQAIPTSSSSFIVVDTWSSQAPAEFSCTFPGGIIIRSVCIRKCTLNTYACQSISLYTTVLCPLEGERLREPCKKSVRSSTNSCSSKLMPDGLSYRNSPKMGGRLKRPAIFGHIGKFIALKR